MIRVVPPGPILDELWPYIEPELARALAYNDFLTTDGLLALARRQVADIAVCAKDGDLEAVGALEILQYPTVRVGNILALGGKPGWLFRYADEAQRWMEQWCRERGCTIIAVAGGRPGWDRLLSRRGWVTRTLSTAWRPVR